MRLRVGVDDDLPGEPDRLADEGFTVDVRREHGEPAELIVEATREFDVDALVIAGRTRSPVGKVPFESVTQAVLLAADRPGPRRSPPPPWRGRAR